ncbi:Hypothetical predicted protein [Olea europaea subsp. europaea]|uniref:DUF7811 domain-containing protein n=1 Tax=Olea europaea subsp. europaea TaxID=158383 RepID=A0A8S0R584_OLEEU|nr:Hypothetical predicted protein [Olea europaea subsp. europaea]
MILDLYMLLVLPFAAIHWVPEERVTLFTADGLIQIGGNLVPRRISSSDKKQGKVKMSQRFQRFQESNYMDPRQGLCLGALFDIAATNGLDMGRRLCIFGFCRSVEMLSDVVEDTVLEHGGEVYSSIYLLEFLWIECVLLWQIGTLVRLAQVFLTKRSI